MNNLTDAVKGTHCAYALRLQGDAHAPEYYYVGSTFDIQTRIAQHTGAIPGGAKWTTLHPPISVLDVVQGFEQATGLVIPYEIVERRPGDVPRLEACPQTAQTVLGWRARRSLEEMCRDGWAWQQANPCGYQGPT